MSSTRRAGLLLALATAGISGVAVFLNSYGVRAVGDPTTYTTAKNLVAATVLLAVVSAGSVSGARVSRPSGRRQWVGLGLVGLIGGAVPFVLFFEGLSRASSVQAAFLHKTLVLWVALLAVTLLRERLRPAHWAAIALLLIGQAGLSGGVASSWGTGEGMIMLATGLWAVEVVLAKRLLADLTSWTVALARMVLGSALLLVWVALRGDLGTLTGMTPTQWAWVLLTGVLLAGYVGSWFAALARAGAVDVTAVLVLGALVTAALAALVQGSPLDQNAAWLAILLVGGMLVIRRGWLDGAATHPGPAGHREVGATP